jgi:SAM-dependent methyltransferase
MRANNGNLSRLQHPRFARAYARAVGNMNRRGGTEHRRTLLAPLYGTVIELGPGDGSSFGLYPPAVTQVLALEPNDYLRALAMEAVASAPVPVKVVAAAAEQIPADDGSADAVVASLLLCSVADQNVVLKEIRRVLRPGGTLAFYEHVRSGHPLLAKAEDLLTPAWGGDSRWLPSQPGHAQCHHRGGVQHPGLPTFRFRRTPAGPAGCPHPGPRHSAGNITPDPGYHGAGSFGLFAS